MKQIDEIESETKTKPAESSSEEDEDEAFGRHEDEKIDLKKVDITPSLKGQGKVTTHS
jgi:hypothetical protein